MNDFEFGDMRYLAMFRRSVDCELSARAMAAYSFIVGQDFYHCSCNQKQIAANTGLDYSGVAVVINELKIACLIREDEHSSKIFAYKPTAEQKINDFRTFENDDWQKEFHYFKMLIRKINGGLSFNQALVYSVLIGLRKEESSLDRLIVPSTNCVGLAKMSGLCKRTVSTIIEELAEKGLILVSNISGKSMSVWIPELGENKKYFVQKGEDNSEGENIAVLAEMINQHGLTPEQKSDDKYEKWESLDVDPDFIESDTPYLDIHKSIINPDHITN